MKVVGFFHNIKHESFKDVLHFIDSEISPQTIVATESPLALSDIVQDTQKDGQYKFLQDICKRLLLKQSRVYPLEDSKLYKSMALIQTWFWFEGRQELLKNQGYKLLSVKRSISMFNQARDLGADFLLLGISHAYHLMALKYVLEPIFIPLPSLEFKRYEDECIQTYLHYWLCIIN